MWPRDFTEADGGQRRHALQGYERMRVDVLLAGALDAVDGGDVAVCSSGEGSHPLLNMALGGCRIAWLRPVRQTAKPIPICQITNEAFQRSRVVSVPRAPSRAGLVPIKHSFAFHQSRRSAAVVDGRDCRMKRSRIPRRA